MINPLLPMVEHAVSYARRFKILDIHPIRDGICGCKQPHCASPGKHPIQSNGLNSATSDEAEIRRRWGAVPDASIAIACEQSGILVFDIDLYHNDLEKLNALEQTLGQLPATVTQRSGSSDGYHYVVNSPGFPTKGALSGVVLRSKAYIVVAPSTHISGNRYEWQEGLSPDDLEPADLPDAWKEAVRRTSEVGVVGVPERDKEPEWLQTIPDETRLAYMKAHLTREQGETKGNSPPGTTFNVMRSAIRGYAVRDPEAALDVAITIYDVKCTPPWGARMHRIVWSAYVKAHTPEWGSSIKNWGSAPKPSDNDIDGALQAFKRKRSSDPQVTAQQTLIKKIVSRDSVYPDEAATAKALIRWCPVGTTDDQIVALLLQSRSNLDNYQLVRDARVAGFAPKLFANLPLTGLPAEPEAEPPVDVADMDAGDLDVLGKLILDEEGAGVKNRADNLDEIMVNSTELKGRIKYNMLTKKIEVSAGSIFSGTSENTLHSELTVWLARRWNLVTNSSTVGELLLMIARRNDYNPIAEYLSSLTWDGVPRIDRWLIDYLGAEDTEFNRLAGRRWLIGACARGFDPGSKMDNVLVLEGGQGIGKSQTCKALAGAWFSDSPLTIGNKDSMQMASYCWIIELAELSSMRASETEAQKAFLSASRDRYRPPYGKAPEEFPRFAVFIGSTNDDKYLVDFTGNRRWWPVLVGHCDVARVHADRDQLWAEAAYRYLHADVNPDQAHPGIPGERWWFGDDAEIELAAIVVKSRRPENMWSGLIRTWTGSQLRPSVGTTKRAWSLAEIAKQALDIAIEKLPQQQRRITEAVKEAGLMEKMGPDGPVWYVPGSEQPALPGSEEVKETSGVKDAN